MKDWIKAEEIYIKYVLWDNVKSKKSRWNFNLTTVKSVLWHNPRNPPVSLGTNMKNGLNKSYFN